MEKEVRLNKLLCKIELYSNKIFPVVIAIIYFMNTVLSYFSIDFEAFSWIAGMSFIPLVKFYISSYTYRFCEYHRMPLHYITLNLIITGYDYYIGIPIDYRTLFTINCCITIIFIFITLYLKVKCQH